VPRDKVRLVYTVACGAWRVRYPESARKTVDPLARAARPEIPMVQIMRQSLFDWHPYSRTRRAAKRADVAAMVDAPVVVDPLDARLADLASSTSTAALTREQLMDRILLLNPTAEVGFLVDFSEGELRDYFGRLQHAHKPRGRASIWQRPDGEPAIACWEAE
jgi:hypothetical protein